MHLRVPFFRSATAFEAAASLVDCSLYGGVGGDGAEVVFELTGGKIDSTSDDWMAAGMGFWVGPSGARGPTVADLSSRVSWMVSGLKWVAKLGTGSQ